MSEPMSAGLNYGFSGRRQGAGPQSDLAGVSVRVGGDTGLESPDKGGTRRRAWGMVGRVFERMLGDPVWRFDIFKPGSGRGETAYFVKLPVQPDVAVINGQRYVHEERVSEVRKIADGYRARMESRGVELDGLRGDVRTAEDAADQLKTELIGARATIAALSQPRVINVAGMVDADLAERYESLRASFETVSIELATAKGLLAESAPVVRLVQDIANMPDGSFVAYSTGWDLRERARGTFKGEADYRPSYTADQERRALDIWITASRNGHTPVEVLGMVAGELGMRRAGA